VTEEMGERCGGGVESVPWRIEAPSGSRIKFTLYDFATGTPYHPAESGATSVGSAHSAHVCHHYGVIKEVGKTETMCGRRQRVSEVYVSLTNSVEVRLSRQALRKEGGGEDKSYFLLHYQRESLTGSFLEI